MKARRKILSCILIIMIMCQTQVFAVWDGSEADRVSLESADSLKKTLINVNSMNIITEAGARPSASVKGSGNYTARWNNHITNTSIRFENIDPDWSEVEWIEMPVYSAKITSANLAMVIRCKEGTGTGSPYLSYQFKVDWQGWKTFKIYINKHMSALNGPDLSKVERVLFSAKDYGGVAHEETDLYFDTIIGHLYDHEKPARDAQALYEATEGAIAVFNHCKNVLSNHKVGLLDEVNVNATATTLNSNTMLPITFYENHLGASLKDENGIITVTLGDKAISFKEGDTAFYASGEEKTFPIAPFEKDGLLYVPLKESVEALGKLSKQYGDLTIIGTDLNIVAFDENEELPSICINEFVNVVIGVESIEKEDFEELQKNYRFKLVGDESNDMTNPYIKNIVEKVDSNAKSTWDTMNYGSDRDKHFALFGTEPIDETLDMGNQITLLLRLAKAWGTYGSVYYKDEKLGEDILSSLEWFYENIYGEDEAQNKGWRDYTLYNWWQWAEEVPQTLSDIFCIMDDKLSVEKKKQYFVMAYKARTLWCYGTAMDDCNSRLKRDLPMAIVTEDKELLKSSLEDFAVVVTPVESGNGYQEDGLFMYHGKFPYTSGYGINTTIAPVSFFSMLSGTKADFQNEYKAGYMDYMRDTYYPILHNGRAQIMFGGRNITSVDDIYSGYQVIRASLYLLGVFGPDEDLWLKQMIRANVNESNEDYILGMLSLDLIDKFVAVMEDDTIPLLGDDTTDLRVYYTGDRVVQQRPDYTVGIAMSSQRIGNYESINVDNKWGWFTGDGALYIYNNGPKQFHLDYFKNVNWARYPGTTEDTREREAAQISLSETWVPKNNFAGGVDFDHEFAAIGMDFQALSNPVNSGFVNAGNGGALPVHLSTLRAKKAWFLFDDEVVALGAGINSNDDAPVFTMVNNRMLYENGVVAGMEDIVIDGEMLEKSASYTKTYKKVGWAHIESEGGYYFPQKGELTVNKTDKNPSFLEMWFEHGINPKNRTYAYVVLPNKTAEETEAYTKASDIQILSNTEKIQAVFEKTLNMKGFIFHEAGELEGIEADNPLVIMTKETEDEYIVKISDAAQTLQSANVTIKGTYTLIEAPEIATVTPDKSNTKITLDLREARGETYSFRFKKN